MVLIKDVIDDFISDNLYNLLQIKETTVIRLMKPEDDDVLRRELFNAYVKTFYGSMSNFDRSKGGLPGRRRFAANVNTYIWRWLEDYYVYYKFAQFLHVDSVIFDNPKHTSQLPLKVSHACRDNCSSAKCPNRKKYRECDNLCGSIMCTNKETQCNFEWTDYLKLAFINVDKGAGIVAKKDLLKGQYLGFVSGKGLNQHDAIAISKDDEENQYVFETSNKNADAMWAVDPKREGNHTRFFNNSCVPNAVFEIWSANSKFFIKFRAKKDIKKVRKQNNILIQKLIEIYYLQETEITIKYNWNNINVPCSCGEGKKCKGTV